MRETWSHSGVIDGRWRQKSTFSDSDIPGPNHISLRDLIVHWENLEAWK